MANNYPNLNPEKALIWRIVHRDNLPWIMRNGLHCANSPVRDPNYVAIGNADLISRRTHRNVLVAPGGTLADYVPFYFTPFSPMMYNIYTGRGEVPRRRNEEICILVSSLPKVKAMELDFVFTDRHAYTSLANFSNELDDLGKIDWPLLQTRNFQRNPDDPEQIERYQAEALVYRQLPITGLIAVVCYTEAVKSALEAQIQREDMKLEVLVLPKWYF
ncbi:MAG: DUF4433 domain-containing protein [Betaproteobacteria bacterium]|nr:DUF4433 domain-containing protein [Betaproteobacteria bacterium]